MNLSENHRSVPFFQSPGKLLFVFVGATVILWTLQCSLLQRILPLDVIETIVWGAQKQLGHYRHPPLSGWLGYAFSCLSGHHDWSLYLLAQLCLACGVFYVYRLGKELFSPVEAAVAALLLYALPYYTPSSMKFCSHFTVMAFMPAMAFYFYRGLQKDRLADWLLFGFFSAAATLGKYAALQFFPACLLLMLLTPTGRKRFKSPGVYLSILVFFLILAPHIHWLTQHDFGPLRHLTERMDDSRKRPWDLPAQTLTALLYPFVFQAVILLVAAWPWKKEARIPRKIDREKLLTVLLFSLVPGLIYVGISIFGGNVILMWFSFLASWTGLTVVALWPWQITEKVMNRLFLLLCVVVFCVFIGTTIDLLIKPRIRIHSDPADFTGQAEAYFAKKSGGQKIPVVFGERWPAGVLENYLPHRPPSCAAKDPCNLELLREKIRKEGALIFTTYSTEAEEFFKAMGRRTELDGRAVIRCRAFLGTREDNKEFLMGCFPPDPEVKK